MTRRKYKKLIKGAALGQIKQMRDFDQWYDEFMARPRPTTCHPGLSAFFQPTAQEDK